MLGVVASGRPTPCTPPACSSSAPPRRAAPEDLVQLLELADTDRRADVVDAVVEAEPACSSQPPPSARPWLRRLLSSRHSSSECVVTMPPSPVVICLFG